MTNTNDVMGVINPTTNTHNNIDDLSFFDFKVEKRPLFFETTEHYNFRKNDSSDYVEGHSNVMTKVDGKHAVVRSDTNECLGVHGRTYKIVPHLDVYKRHADAIKNSSAYDPDQIEIIDQLWDKGAKARRTIHFLNHTKRVSDEDVVTMRSDTFNSLDGSFAFQVFSGMYRKLCLNTLVFGGEKFYHSKQKHTSNINYASAVSKIANSVDLYNRDYDKLCNWRDTKVTDEQVAMLFANTIAKRKSESATIIKDALKEEGVELKQLINVKLNDFLMHQYGKEKESLGGTLYAVYNALTHWSTHTDSSWERTNTKGETVTAYTSRNGSNVGSVQIERENKVRSCLDSDHWQELSAVA